MRWYAQLWFNAKVLNFYKTCANKPETYSPRDPINLD